MKAAKAQYTLCPVHSVPTVTAVYMGINESRKNVALLRDRDSLNIVDSGVKTDTAIDQTGGGKQLSLKRHEPSLAHLFVCDAGVTHGFTN